VKASEFNNEAAAVVASGASAAQGHHQDELTPPPPRWISALHAVASSYDSALRVNPVVTKALTSFVGFALGDRLAQSIGGAAFDPWRCMRLALYGLLLDGPVGHAFYKFLGEWVQDLVVCCRRVYFLPPSSCHLLPLHRCSCTPHNPHELHTKS
jgi:hypothetical protein